MSKKTFLSAAVLFAAIFCPQSAFAQEQAREVQQEEQQDTITAAVVTAIENYRIDTQTGLEHLDKEKLTRGFALLSTPDVLKVIQALPGVASGTELMSGLFVHGGDGSDNLYLLDGVPLYQVSHLAGLFSSFNTDVVDRVDFYKSGFPGRYGGRLSSVVDVRTQDGNYQEFHGNFAIGLIDGRLHFEGPIVQDKLSYNIAVRRSWLDAISAPALAIRNIGRQDKMYAGYSFMDANASLSWKVNSRNKMTARFYWGDDALRYKKTDRDSVVTATEELEYDTKYGDDAAAVRVRWGNILGSLTWYGVISENMSYNLTAYYSRNMSTVSFSTSDWSWDEEFGEMNASTKETNHSLTEDAGIKADFSYRPHRSHHLRFGAKCNMLVFNPENTREYINSSGTLQSHTPTRRKAAETALYIEDEMTLLPWFSANIGLRYAPAFVRGKVWHSIEPRAALKFRCCDAVDIKASYTEMSQFIHRLSTTYLDIPGSCFMPSTKDIAPMHSRQFAAGIYSRLPYSMELNVEGFYKTMDNLLEYVGGNSFFPPLDSWETDFSKGRGRAYGMEFEFAYRTPATDVSLYYTLSWSQRRFDAMYFDWYPDRNDNRHKITIQASHKFSEKFELYAAWNYHTGSYFTVPTHTYFGDRFMEFYDKPNNVRIPDYHRLDVGMNFHKKTKRGNLSTWNLSFYNLYCRMNAINAYIDKREDGSYYGRAEGLVPIIPSFSYTLEF